LTQAFEFGIVNILMDNQLPNFPVQSQTYIAPNLNSPQTPGEIKTPSLNLNKKWILIMIVAVFLFICLPAAVYFLGKQQATTKSAKLAQTMNSINITPAAITITPTLTPTPTLAPVATDSGILVASPTANWKTYTNIKYTYSIQYPDTWYNKEYSDTKTGSGFASTGVPNTSVLEEIKINAIAKIDNAKLAFADYVKVAGINEFGYKSLASIEPITTISGVTGYETTWTSQATTSASLPITYFEIPSDQAATVEVFLNKNEDMDIYQQMLSTLKLTQ
jgi:hypothetical protein